MGDETEGVDAVDTFGVVDAIGNGSSLMFAEAVVSTCKADKLFLGLT